MYYIQWDKRASPMDGLFDYLRENGFNAEQQDTIIRQFRRRELKKGELYLQEGQVSHQLGFVEKGLFQYFCLRNGEEITIYTAGPNNYVVSLSSFLKQKPARETIRSLTDGVVWVIHKLAFDQLRRDIPRFEAFYVNLLEEEINCIEDSRFNLLTLSAEERYQKLMNEEPHLLQEVPLQYLASILGVTPRHLSRIRGQVR